MLMLWGISAAYEQEPYLKMLLFRGLDALKPLCGKLFHKLRLRKDEDGSGTEGNDSGNEFRTKGDCNA